MNDHIYSFEAYEMKFKKYNIYGSTVYLDDESNISIQNHNDKWYVQKNGDEILFNAGFVNVGAAMNMIENLSYYIESLSQLGYEYQPGTCIFQKIDAQVTSTVYAIDGEFTVESKITTYHDLHKTNYITEIYKTSDFEDLTDYIVEFFDTNDVDIFSSVFLDSISHPIFASISSREATKNMVRVKSSNIWSYCIDIKNRKDKFGTVYVQFKGKDGGPNGGLYRYFDVPVNLWRKWLGYPSKGSFFWRYIRNNFKYSKLDGDKKGKLPNAVN